MNRNICFYEPDEILAERFVEYFLSHGLGEYNICYYSDQELLLKSIPAMSVRLWILDVSIREQFPLQGAGNVLWLTGSKEDADAIFKYRSAAVLLQTILSCLEVSRVPGDKRAGPLLIAFYTPIRRSLQTTYAMTLSHVLSRRGRTLYLNLEGYSGFEQMYPGCYSKDISDFIYYFHHSKENNPTQTMNFIYRLGEVDMIPPVLNPANLQGITSEMWQSVLRALSESKVYDYIVLDISDFICGAFDILKMSHHIFSLKKPGERAEAKWQQYIALLEALGLQDITLKTQEISLPHIHTLPVSLENCETGELLDYVEQAAKEVGLL